jgi:hypothetical protein
LHDLLHVLQADHAPFHAQSTAHVCVLQDCVSALCGHDVPPFSGGVFVRERDWAPVPHDLVHVLHCDQSPSSQFLGHSKELQVRSVWWNSRASTAAREVVVLYNSQQSRPLPDLGVVYVALRVCTPWPHDVLHVVHGPNVAVQFTSHDCGLQSSLSSTSPRQTTPPWSPGVTIERERDRTPPSHARVQGVQPDQSLHSQLTAQGFSLQVRASLL